MLQALLRAPSQERALTFIACRNEGYASEIARFYGAPITPIRKQLERLEADGVVVSRMIGNVRVYAFNPAYPFLPELRALIEKSLAFYPEQDKAALMMNRRRPRKAGKPT